MAAPCRAHATPACMDAPYARLIAPGEKPMRLTIRSRTLACFSLLVLLAGGTAQARQGEMPYSLAHPAKAGVDVPIVEVAPVRPAERRRAADQQAVPGSK